jgi:hypothetical protein
MTALLAAADNVLKGRTATDGLWSAVKSRSPYLALANVALAALSLLVTGLTAALVGGAWLLARSTVTGGVPGLAGPLDWFGWFDPPVVAGLVVVVLVGTVWLATVDLAVRFVKPAVVVGGRSPVRAIRESVALVRDYPRTALGYYAVLRGVGLAFGALALAVPAGLLYAGGVDASGIEPALSPFARASVPELAAVVLTAYVARAVTYAVTLPYTVNVYQFLRYDAGRAGAAVQDPTDVGVPPDTGTDADGDATGSTGPDSVAASD